MTRIKEILAEEILDSRGNPTIKCEVVLEDGSKGIASVPSGASTGSHEALELRDGGDRYFGMGVLKAVENVNTVISKSLKGADSLNQKKIDKIMIDLDGTANKSKLGANAILSVSLAVSRAASSFLKIPLYHYLRVLYESEGIWQDNLLEFSNYEKVVPFMNVLNGGKHAENNIDIQETMIVPQGETFAKSLEIGTEVYHSLKEILLEAGLSTTVGDEGGFAPNLKSNEEALEFLVRAIEKAGYKPGRDVKLAMDVAASVLYHTEDGGKYILKLDNAILQSKQLIGLYQDWLLKYPLISIEDPLDEDDFESWKDLTSKLGDKVQLIGDDFFATNPERIKKGIKEKAANSVLIKVNQIGTLSEAFEAIKIAKSNDYKIMVSHRSGETDDAFIADLAVAVSAGQIKAGAPARSERVTKYNRLLEIEEEIKSAAGS
ncbi:MAG: phosphopyruvate hydratase [Patescibacteria group bacterium]|nr:phosphopyruvate hydratase [Patescibacteria group bacterium]MCL5093648.1 phosphopyruvate hydratase [Patescibacteria group bacterium]